MSELKKHTIGDLFMNVLQHMKCIEIRLDFAKAATNQKQKYALGLAVNKMNSAINTLCDLLGDSEMVLKIKKELDKSDLVYVMLLTEQLSGVPTDDLENISELIDNYLINKYGAEPE